MNNNKPSVLEKIVGWSALHLLPGNLTLGFPSRKLAEWYDTNGYYEFKEGEIIALKNPKIFRYGDARGWVVKGYAPDGAYIVDANGKLQKHFKWNIEHHFRRQNN